MVVHLRPILAFKNHGYMMALLLFSPAFHDGGEIPARYTCEGQNLSPPLAWSGAPANARSFVLIADDPDAPDPQAPRRVWVHWLLYNLPASVTGLPEAVGQLPTGTIAGITDFQHTHYGGPCPPIGRHRYFFKLYALDTALPDMGPATKAQVEHGMAGHILAQTQLMGTYLKHRR